MLAQPALALYVRVLNTQYLADKLWWLSLKIWEVCGPATPSF